MKTFSTRQAASEVGISWLTLARWVKAGKVHPSQVLSMNSVRIFLWTPGDVERLRRFKAAHYWKHGVLCAPVRRSALHSALQRPRIANSPITAE